MAKIGLPKGLETVESQEKVIENQGIEWRP